MNTAEKEMIVVEHGKPIEHIKCNWAIYAVTVLKLDGSLKEGFMEGDGHMWACETFEEVT